MTTNTFLVCNAHLDIAWLWSWEEGVVEALSTFRTAVRFCKEYDGFVFNHNEAILYEWIEEYDPALFEEIRQLVECGKWHIMGGWYLQPDCNMPSGESFVRQTLKGQRFFLEHFGKKPTTAINFDPFGHTRGLVQILKKSGYDSYIVCRPGQEDFPLDDDDFIWVGYDGSEILVHRVVNGYSSGRGRIQERIERYLAQNPERENGLLLWGIGNHGGGPSKEDLDRIGEMQKEGFLLQHTTPEAYFDAVRQSGKTLKRVERSMQHWGVGCYTSLIRLKEYHRRLESEYYLTEKMVSHVSALHRMEYPRRELDEALRDLLYMEFHDILPGSAIKRVEEDGIRLAHHGLEILSRLKVKAFLSLIHGDAHRADEQGRYETPIYVYNPHPFAVEDIFEYELALPATIREGFGRCVLRDGASAVDTQTEREENNVPIQWRRRMAFHLSLAPYSMKRLDFSTVVEEQPPRRPEIDFGQPEAVFENEEMTFLINSRTGLADGYRVHGKEYLKSGSFCLSVFEDTHDSWGMTKKRYDIPAGSFHICKDSMGTPKMRIIEEGPVRTVVECEMEYGHSRAVMRYKIPKKGTEVEIEVLLKYAEELRGIKLGVHTIYENGVYLGDTAFGVEHLDGNMQEVVAQKWTGMTDGETMVTLINDSVYGSSCCNGSFYPTLIKSCGYAAHPMAGRVHMPADRYIDCGEHISKTYRFYLNAGEKRMRMERIGAEACIKHERPFVLNGFTDMKEEAAVPFMEVSDCAVLCSAVKYAEDGSGLVVRLFNSTEYEKTITLSMKRYGIEDEISFGPFEVKTYRYEFASGQWEMITLLENKMEEKGEQEETV